MTRLWLTTRATRACRLVVGVAGLPIALWAQLPPGQPLQPPPTQPMPTQPAPLPTDPTQLVMLSPQVPLQPTRPEEILEQQLLGLTKPLECGPAPEDWAERLAMPHGTRPVEVAIRQIGPGAAVVSWRGAPWATKHEVRWVDDPSGPSGPSLYCLMQWGYPIQGLEETGGAVTRVAEGVVVTGEVKSLSLEAAPPPAPAPTPALVAMQDTVYGQCYGRTYRYTVMAFYADSAPAQNPTIVSFTTPAGPAPPELPRLTAHGETMGATLTWGALPRVYAYRIYREGQRVGEVLPKQDVVTKRWLWPDTTYTDQVPAAGVYSYRVEALLSSCEYAPGPSGEALAVSGTVAAKAMPTPIWGFADLHVHQFANLAFGGRMFWGSPYSPNGATPEERIKDALPWCDYLPGWKPSLETPAPTPVHGAGGAGDIVGTAASLFSESGGIGHKVGGHPQFDGWPRWNTFTHQQVYVDWLRRALDGGLKLMVMYAVNNEAVCDKVNRAPGRNCSDMEAIDLQIAGAKALESWIDTQSGGAGKGWYRIVYSPQQARDAIAKGQLAVVLGTEVPTLFNCRADGKCTAEHVSTQLAIYRAKGIRQIVPVHNADNGFGGAAVYTDIFTLSNKKIAGDYFRVRDCSAEGVRFRFDEFGGKTAQVVSALESIFGALPPDYSALGQCNSRGLTTVGAAFIRELMHQKMLIDVDHMSWLTLGSVLAMANANGYPVLNSHTGFLDISVEKKRSEGQKTEAQLKTIAGGGGLVAPILFQGKRGDTRWAGSKIPHDCGNSSQSWAQAYLYAINFATNPNGLKAVALGSDFNGLAGQPSPRFGPEACNRGDKGPQAELGGRVVYPFKAHGNPNLSFDRSVVGKRTFDINDDGLAHIGMLPDFIQDLKVQGLTDADLQPLFRSAEAYIRMWEQIESTTVTPLP